MTNTGTVQKLYVSIKEKGRITLSEITLDAEGIQEDKFYAKGIERSILIASLDSYKLANTHKIDVEYGSLGENLLIDINPYHLKCGDKISIGNVLLEITQNCTICNSLSKIDVNLPSVLKNDRGIFAKTLTGGSINKGDRVKFL